MLEARSQVGEHVLLFKTESGETMDWLQQSFDIEIVQAESLVEQPDLKVMIHEKYGRPFEGFKVDISPVDGCVIYERADYRLEVDCDHHNATISVYDFFALKHALMNLYSAFIVHHKWGLLIHSSCVIQNGGAYLFSGRSGAGKSTIARLSQPRPLLSDEATIVKVAEEGVSVFDSPFRSDTQPDFHKGPIPLTAIHLIHQSKDVKREPTQMTQGVVQLMDKVFYWAYHQEQTKTILKMYEQLVRQVPIYDLHFQKNDTFWEAIS